MREVRDNHASLQRAALGAGLLTRIQLGSSNLIIMQKLTLVMELWAFLH